MFIFRSPTLNRNQDRDFEKSRTSSTTPVALNPNIFIDDYFFWLALNQTPDREVANI